MSKQFYTWFTCCLFALLTALPLTVNADELTVHDGTATVTNVPMYVLYFDDYTRTQVVFPAEELEDMAGGHITSLKWYTTSANIPYTTVSPADIYVMEVDYTSISAFENKSSATIVYQGTSEFVEDGTGGSVVIQFNTPYKYAGGNLLIGCENTTDAGYKSINFYGETVTGASVGGYNSSSLSGVSPSQRNFLPKTTFTYTPGEGATCAKPGAIALGNVTTTSASFSWTASSGEETEWYVRVKDAQGVALANYDSIAVSGNPSCTITGLNPATSYTLSVEVMHVCEGGEYSVRTGSLSFTTECDAITSFPWHEDFESMPTGTISATCWKNEHLSGSGSKLFSVETTTMSNNATHKLQLPDMSSGTFTKLALPLMNIPAANGYEFIISVLRNATSYPKEGLFVLAGADTLAFIPRAFGTASEDYLNELPAEEASGWYTYHFTIPNAGEQSISLVGRSMFGSATYADNLIVRALPTCLPIKKLWVDEEAITATSAKLVWNPSTTTGDYQVLVKKGNAVLADERVDGDTTFVLGNLTHSTYYKDLSVTVTTICSPTDSSDIYTGKVTFNTACQIKEFSSDSLILGFEEFESGALLADMPCWDTIRDAGVTADWKISTPGYNNTAKSAYIASRGAGKYAVLVSPAIQITSGYELQAYAKESSVNASDSLIFYVNDAPALEGATRIGDMKALSTSWQQFRQELGQSGELYILIQAYGAGAIYVDELLLKPAPVCPLTTGLVRDSLSYDYVRFSWNAAEGQNAWKVNISDTRGEIAVYDEVVNDPFYEIDYLEPLTTDTVTVKVIGMCEAGNSEEVLEETFIFTTLASCPIPDSLSVSDITGNSAKIAWKIGISDNYNVRYREAGSDGVVLSEGFEGGSMPDGWTQTGDGTWSVTSGDYSTTTGAAEGLYNAKITISAFSGSATLITPVLDLAAVSNAKLSYWHIQRSWSGDNDELRVYYRASSSDSWTLIPGQAYTSAISSWTLVENVELPNPSATYQLAFEMSTNYGYGVAIDDIKITGTPSEAAEWISVGSVEQKSAHLTGLTPETKYEAQAQGICGDELSDWSSSVIFTTLPACILPANPTVRAIGVDSAVVAWSATHELYSVLIKQDTTILFQNEEYAGDSIILRGLTPATKYTINVSLIGLCSDELKSDTVVAPLSFITNCVPVTELPWSENFDAYAGSTSSSAPDGYPDDQLPLCWSFLNRSASSSSYPQLFISSNSGYPVAGKCLFFKSSKDEPLYAILPEFAFTLANKQIVFSYRNEGVSTSNGTLHLGYMTDVTDVESYVELQDFAQTTEITQHTIALATIPAGARVAFKYEGGTANNYYLAIDEIRVEKAPDCAKPTAFAVDSVSTHSISLSWASQSGISAWRLDYKKASAEVWTALEAPVNGTVVVLDSLDASTLYNVRLAAMCAPDTDPESLSAYVELSVATECETIASFPWSENFDAYTPSSSERVIPTCWNAINTTTNSSYQQYPTIITDELAPTAPNSLAFVSYYSSYSNYDPQDQYAVLPEVEGISGLRMKLYAAAYNSYGTVYNATFTVGVMSNPSDVSTFEAIATNTATSEEFEPFTISFANYNGQGKYIAIKMAAASGSTYRSVFIDDIQIEEIPDCLEPAGLTVSNVTVEGATITWDAVEDGAWQYAVMSAAVAPADSDFVATTDTFVVISGKADNADFIFYLRTVCGEEVSPSVQIPFHTLQLPAEVGNAFSDNFEGENKWLFLNSAKHGWVVGGAAHNGEGTHAMYVSTDNGATHSYNNSGTNIVYAMKAFNLTAGNYIFGYDWLANGEGATNDWDYLRVALVPASVQLTVGQIPTGFTQSSLPAGWIALDGGSLLNLKQTWQSFESAEMEIAAGTYIVVFAWKNDGSGGSNPPAAIDNFRISKITCSKPTGLAISDITSLGATISWNAIENGAWFYAVAPASAAEPADADFVATTDTFVVINDKVDNAEYIFYLRFDCGEDGASESSRIAFRTLQLPVAVGNGFSDNFEGENNWLFNNSDKHGWVLGAAAHNGEGTHAMYVSTDNGATHTYTMSGTNIVYATKAFTFTDGNYVFAYDWLANGESSFDYMRVALVPASVQLTAGTTPTGLGTSTLPTGWIALDGGSKLNLMSSWQNFESAELAIAAGTYNVVFAWKNDNSGGTNPPAAIDNFSISKILCIKPANLQVAESGITSSSAVAEWTAEEGQNAWQIALDTVATFNPDSVDSYIAADSISFVLDNLDAETTYYLYVRANCGEDGFSAWSAIASFTTASACETPNGLAAAEITVSSALISWNTFGLDSFNIRYGEGAAWSDTIGVNAGTFLLEDLEPNTTYNVQVQAACADSIWSDQLSFKTACTAFSLADNAVYTEDFESYEGVTYNSALGVAPDCWMVDAENTSHIVPHVIGSGSYCYTHSGSNALTFYGSGNCYAALPLFEQAISSLQISFWMQTESDSYGILTLGYITDADPGDWSTYQAIDTFANVKSMTQHELMLNNVPAEAHRLVFRWYYSSQWSCCIDDIEVSLIPTCLKPTGVVASDVRSHAVTLDWTSDADAWQICLDGDEDNLIDVDTVPFILTGLAADTVHTVKVRANCGEQDGVSLWSNIVRFTTLVACPAPTGLKAELTPGDGSVALLSWDAMDANAWVVEYSLNADMSDSISVEVEAATLSLTGLTADTTYYARVKADCGDEDGVSLWSSVISFVPTDRYEMIVNDGTATNTYIPFYLYYIEQPNSESQFIVPAEKLTSIAGDTITALTFYASQTVKFDSATFEVYMAEVNYTTVDTTEWSAMNKVMEEAHLSLVNNQMVVSLSTPYEYQGGNLMIGFKQPKKHTTYYNYVSWYGENAEGASYSIYGGSTRYAGQRNFLPKMKINFIPTDEETAVEEILNGAGSDDKAVKFIRDNRVYILRDGVVYDILGAVVR